MAEEELSANALVDAKNEYTKLLTSYLTPCITEGFISLYEDAKNEKEEKRNDSRYDDYSEIQIFQDFIKKIPKWNQDIIDKESDRIVQRSKCDWLERLLYGVFVSNAKVLSIVRIQPKKDDKMRLKIPKLRNFVHKCYVECGRELYKVAYLFDDEDITSIEKQKNIRDINSIVREGVIEAVRKLLPIQDILKDCIGNIGGENTMNSTIQSEATGGDGVESEDMFRKFTSSNKLKNGIEEIHSETEGLFEEDDSETAVSMSAKGGNEESIVSQKSARSLKKAEESVVSQKSARSLKKAEESVVSQKSARSHSKKERQIEQTGSEHEKENAVFPEQKEESLVSLKEESQSVIHHQQETSVVSHQSEVSERTNATIKKIRTSSIIRNKDRRKMMEQEQRKREPTVEKMERTRDNDEIISYDLQDYVEEEYISDNLDN
jgi:hypothetical protein